MMGLLFEYYTYFYTNVIMRLMNSGEAFQGDGELFS